MTPDLLTHVWAHPDRRPELKASEWEAILGQARKTGLLGRLAQHHVDHNWLSAVPDGPRPYLEGALKLVDRQRHEVQWEVDSIRRALKHAGSPIVMLKGAAYFVAGLPPSRGRLFSDIDIMVERRRLPEVESALFRAGWISERRDAYKERYYREWMHEIPPLTHVQRGTVIDVHHTITPPTSRFKVDAAKLLERKVNVDDRGDLFVLAPVDMVLHSAVHLFQEGEFDHGMRDLLDLNDLLLHFGKNAEFWASLFARAAEIGLNVPLFHALYHINRLFGTTVPADFHELQKLIEPNWIARTTMGWLLRLAVRPHHPSCEVRFSGLARWALYVRSHYLRMPPHLVIPHLLRKAYMRQFPKKETVVQI